MKKVSVMEDSSKVEARTPSHSGITSLEKKLKAFLLSMKIVGVYFDPVSASKINTRRPRCGAFALKLYCFTCLAVLWANFIRALTGLLPSDEGLSLRIIVTGYYLQCALNSTIILIGCHRLRHLRAFYKHWDTLCQNSVTDNTENHVQPSPLLVKVAVGIGWLILIITLGVIYSVHIIDNETLIKVTTYLIRPFPPYPIFIGINCAICALQIGALMFSFIFVIFLSRLLSTRFMKLKTHLAEKIKEAQGNVPEELALIRSHYVRMCQGVEIINGSIKWLLGFTYLLEIGMLCFLSYMVVNGSRDVFMLSSNIFWLVHCFLIVIILTITSSNVHDAAHSFQEPLHEMQTNSITVDQIGQLQLFLAKLASGSIGFTAGGFFVISWDFILTLGGLYITYFFLLLQFKID